MFDQKRSKIQAEKGSPTQKFSVHFFKQGSTEKQGHFKVKH